MRRRCIRHGALVVMVAAALAGAVGSDAGAGRTKAAVSPTWTTVTSSKSTSVYGESVTLRAVVVVASSTIPATGSVTFAVDGATLAAGVTLSGGLATVSTSSLSAGSHAVTVTYAGSGLTYSGSSGSMTQTVSQASTTASLTLSPNPVVYGQTITITTTVAPVGPGAGVPTGTVAWLISSSLPYPTAATLPLTNGKSTLYLSTLGGSYVVTGTYQGDTNFKTSSTGPVNGTVNKVATTVTVTSSANPSTFNQPPTITVTVAPVSPGTGNPTGAVSTAGTTPGRSYAWSTSLLAGSLGKATYSATYAPGTITIIGSFAGDATFAPSTSAPFVQTVTKPSQAVDIFGVPATPVAYGSPLTFTIGVKVGAGARIPTGTLTLSPFDAAGNSTKTLSATGSATFTTTAGANATGSYAATYSGDDYYKGGTYPKFTVTVTKVSSSVAVGASASSVTVGDALTLSATVTGAGTAGGTVEFTDGAQSLGPPVALVGGKAELTVKASDPGKHTFHAAFSGTPGASASESTVEVAVAPAAAPAAPADKREADTGAKSPAPTPPTTTAGAGVAARPGAKAGAAKPAAKPTARPTARPGANAGAKPAAKPAAAAAGKTANPKTAKPKTAKPIKPAAPKAKKKPTGK